MLKIIGNVLKTVFRKPVYVLGALVLALVLLCVIVWLPNMDLLSVIWGTDIALSDKIAFFAHLVLALPFSIGWGQTISVIATVVIFGINMSVLAYYIKHVAGPLSNKKGFFAQMGGLVIALLGLGCASCGALFLTPLLGTTAAGALAFVPHGSLIFSLVGIALLLWSLYAVSKKIATPYG